MSPVEIKFFRFFFACALFYSASGLYAGETKTFTRVITGPEAEYVIEVAGTLDPENVEIIIENLGVTPVLNPRITVNGLYDWYDVNSMAAEITADCRTDEEKALAVWQWVHWKRFQRSAQDRSSLHPVRAMNGYGYGICGHTAAWLKALWTAAGLTARVQEIWGHTISEVYYNGGWHMLDGNVKVFYTSRDNQTIASLAELEKDGWLIERTIHPRDPWVRQPDPPARNKEFVSYITTSRDNYEEHSYDSEIEKNYNMSYTLKPGEKLIRWWKPVLEKFEARDKRPLAPQRYANGRLIWEPDLAKVDVTDYLNIIENVTTRHRNGQDPAINIGELHDESYTRPARFTIPVNSAYPVIGGRFWCKLVKDPGGASASVFFGEPSWGQGNLYTFRWGSGAQNIEVDLDHNILENAPVYDYQIGFTLKGNARAGSPAQAGVEWFKSVSDLQVSPHGLPGLSRGVNVVRYRDGTQGESKKVRITHKWLEMEDNHAPGRVVEAVSPKGSEVVNKLAPALKWGRATDEDAADSVVDYQVLVSLRPDCRWPVSMTLYQNVGSDKCEWTVPKSFLNPGTTYYWKIRARDSRDTVGEWGEIFSFKTSARAR